MKTNPYFFLFFILALHVASAQICPTNSTSPKVLLAGDSWAQYMWDDATHNAIFDKFGQADKKMISESLGSSPGAGYTGTAYAISGSEAREWADTANYPYIANVVNAITNNPTVETVVLSIGGNDILAGKSGGGFYQDMDLDVPGSEAALFNTIKNNTLVIIDGILAVHPDVEILLSSYDYPNFSISGFFCSFYACPKREDLSYDPNNPISDAELNQMMITVENERISWLNLRPQLKYDNAIGLSHYYYGDGNSAPYTLPLPEQSPPYSANFYGGNPSLPSLRSNFRNGFDPIHLDAEAYEYKIIHQTLNTFMPKFRSQATATVYASGNSKDGWTTGNATGTNAVRVGDVNETEQYKGILDFDTSNIPSDAAIESVSLYLLRNNISMNNPFVSGALGAAIVEVKTGVFGTLAIENSDFSEVADAVDAGCFHGTVTANGYALRIDLNASGLSAINKSGNTQFRLSFPNADANSDYLDFNTGDAILDTNGATVGLAEYMNNAKPFLDINYTTTLSTNSITASKENIALYPNPVKATFALKGLQFNNYTVEIITQHGQVVKTIKGYNRGESIPVSELNNGLYFVKVSSQFNSQSLVFVKSH
jgi:hypothetical protein